MRIDVEAGMLPLVLLTAAAEAGVELGGLDHWLVVAATVGRSLGSGERPGLARH